MNPVYLDITTWDGYDPTASHYYGTLNDRAYSNKIELTDKKGDKETMRIDSEGRLITLAKESWLKEYPESKILIVGSPTRCEPQTILAVRDESLEGYMEKVNELAKVIAGNYTRHGDFKDESVYDDALDKWEKLTKEIS